MQVILADFEGLSIQTKITTKKQKLHLGAKRGVQQRPMLTMSWGQKEGTQSMGHGSRQLCSLSLYLKTSELQQADPQRDAVCRSHGSAQTLPQHTTLPWQRQLVAREVRDPPDCAESWAAKCLGSGSLSSRLPRTGDT